MKEKHELGPRLAIAEDEDLRRRALDMAMRIGGFENSVDRVIEDAIKIEAYLRGELESPNLVDDPKGYFFS